MGANSGRQLSPEWRSKIGEAQKGRKQSEETKAKRRSTLTAYWVSNQKHVVAGMLKTCSKCRKELEVESNFNRRMRVDAAGIKRNIWQSQCNSCVAKRRGVCTTCGEDKKLSGGGLCGKCYFNKVIATDPIKLKNFQRGARLRHLLKKYGITLEQYDAMLEEQQGSCAICGTADNGSTQDGKNPLPLSVDHDHATGKIRRLLCTPCNFLVGFLEVNPVRYEAAKAYLDKYKDKQ